MDLFNNINHLEDVNKKIKSLEARLNNKSITIGGGKFTCTEADMHSSVYLVTYNVEFKFKDSLDNEDKVIRDSIITKRIFNIDELFDEFRSKLESNYDRVHNKYISSLRFASTQIKK